LHDNRGNPHRHTREGLKILGRGDVPQNLHTRTKRAGHLVTRGPGETTKKPPQAGSRVTLSNLIPEGIGEKDHKKQVQDQAKARKRQQETGGRKTSIPPSRNICTKEGILLLRLSQRWEKATHKLRGDSNRQSPRGCLH